MIVGVIFGLLGVVVFAAVGALLWNAVEWEAERQLSAIHDESEAIKHFRRQAESADVQLELPFDPPLDRP